MVLICCFHPHTSFLWPVSWDLLVCGELSSCVSYGTVVLYPLLVGWISLSLGLLCLSSYLNLVGSLNIICQYISSLIIPRHHMRSHRGNGGRGSGVCSSRQNVCQSLSLGGYKNIPLSNYLGYLRWNSLAWNLNHKSPSGLLRFKHLKRKYPTDFLTMVILGEDKINIHEFHHPRLEVENSFGMCPRRGAWRSKWHHIFPKWD